MGPSPGGIPPKALEQAFHVIPLWAFWDTPLFRSQQWTWGTIEEVENGDKDSSAVHQGSFGNRVASKPTLAGFLLP